MMPDDAGDVVVMCCGVLWWVVVVVGVVVVTVVLLLLFFDFVLLLLLLLLLVLLCDYCDCHCRYLQDQRNLQSRGNPNTPARSPQQALPQVFHTHNKWFTHTQ